MSACPSTMHEPARALDRDDVRPLEALGYSSKFDRTMTPWQNFSLGFTYLSPVVGVYSVFAMALTTGGPPVAAVVEMVSPRAPQDRWYSDYGMLLGTAVVVLSGLLYMALVRPYDRGHTPAGDAHLLHLESVIGGSDNPPRPADPISAA